MCENLGWERCCTFPTVLINLQKVDCTVTYHSGGSAVQLVASKLKTFGLASQFFSKQTWKKYLARIIKNHDSRHWH